MPSADNLVAPLGTDAWQINGKAPFFGARTAIATAPLSLSNIGQAESLVIRRTA